MLSFIADNYDQVLTINDVAEHVKLNANYAMGIFQRVMQLTMKQYITAMRINHVRALLSDTDKTILDVALTAGFRSSSRFYDTFSKFVGMSPQQYRKLSQSRPQIWWAEQPETTGVTPAYDPYRSPISVSAKKIFPLSINSGEKSPISKHNYLFKNKLNTNQTIITRFTAHFVRRRLACVTFIRCVCNP